MFNSSTPLTTQVSEQSVRDALIHIETQMSQLYDLLQEGGSGGATTEVSAQSQITATNIDHTSLATGFLQDDDTFSNSSQVKVASSESVKAFVEDQTQLADQAGHANDLLTTNGTITSWTAQVSGLPPGLIAAFGTGIAPLGWFLCDGAAYSRETYSDLWNIIGITWGPGDGVGTFNVPELKGAVLRGTGVAGVNSDYAGPSTVGAYQTPQNLSHRHSVSGTTDSTSTEHTHSYTHSGAGSGAYHDNAGYPTNSHVGVTTGGMSANSSHSHAFSANSAYDGGDEVRAYSRGVQYMIKY